MLYSPLVHRIGIFFGPRHWHCFFFFFLTGIVKNTLFTTISLCLMVKITRPLKNPFWNTKDQIHFLHEKTKTEVSQLTQVHEAIGRWLRKRLSRPLETSLTRHRISEPEGNSRIKPRTFKIKKSKAQKWLEIGTFPTFPSSDVSPVLSMNHV